jgi:HK97 family phage portal protein
VTSLLRALADRVIDGEVVEGEVLPRSSGGALLNRIPVPIVSRRPTFGESLSSSSTDGGDKEAQAGAMTANGTLFAIVGGISFDVSAVEWKLYRKAASGKAEDRVEVTTHPSIDLFDQPNDFMVGQEFFEVVQQHMELTGEGWPLVAFALGMPFELWPVYPHRMTPVPHPDDFLAGYVYRSPDGQKIPLGVKEVKPLRQPHPLNLFRGLSAVQAISSNLASARAASAWNERFFTNSAMPGGIIEQDIAAAGMADHEFEAFTQRWREAHQGVGNAHRVAILEAGMKWVANSYSLKDLQFVELHGVGRDVVREAYRYPISKLGTVEDVNRANGEAQEVRYARDILKPRLTRWKAWRNRSILPMFGGDWRSLEWDFADPAPDDKELEATLLTAKATAWSTFVNGGVDGKAAIEALELPKQLGDAWTKPEPPTLPGAPKKAPPKDVAAWGGAWLPSNETPAEPVTDLPPELAYMDERWRDELGALITQWQAEVSPEQVSHAVEAVEDAVAAGDVAALAAIVVPVLGAALIAEAAGVVAAVGVSAVVAEAAAAGVVAARGVVDLASLTSHAEATAALLAQGLAVAAGREAMRLSTPGASAEDVSTGVRAFLEGLSDRALRDALGSALTRALNAGRLNTYAAAYGRGLRLYANEVLDGNTCKPCAAIDGQLLPTVEAAQLAYGGAGYLWCEGGVRCRGTVVGDWSGHDGA